MWLRQMAILNFLAPDARIREAHPPGYRQDWKTMDFPETLTRWVLRPEFFAGRQAGGQRNGNMRLRYSTGHVNNSTHRETK